MSVVVSDNRNTSYNGNISTTNGFYRAEASNLGNDGGRLALSTTRTIPVTFANAGNCQGIILAVYMASGWYQDKPIRVELRESGVVRATVELTKFQIFPFIGETYFGTQVSRGFGFVPFKFPTPYAINTSAGVWDFRISLPSGVYSVYEIATSDGTNPFYITWCDNKVTYTDTVDTPVFLDPITVSSTIYPKTVSTTGTINYGVQAIVCASPLNTPNLKIDNNVNLNTSNKRALFDGALASVNLGAFTSATNATLTMKYQLVPFKTRGTLFSDKNNSNRYLGSYEQGSVSTILSNSAGTVTIAVDGVTVTTRGALYNALSDYKIHTITMTGVSISTWANFQIMVYEADTTYSSCGVMYDITMDETSNGSIDHNWNGYGITNADWLDTIGTKHGTVQGYITEAYYDTVAQLYSKGSYLVFDGRWCYGSYSQIRIGSETTPISNLSIIYKDTTSLSYTTTTDTQIHQGFVPIGNSLNSYYAFASSIEIFGSIPTNSITYLSSDALSGQAKINVLDSTNFVVGNRIVIGKEDFLGRSDSWKFYTILSKSGNELTLDRNLARTRKGPATASDGHVIRGGAVFNLDSIYGVTVYNDNVGTAAQYYKNWLTHNSLLNFKVRGLKTIGVSMFFRGNAVVPATSSYYTESFFEDCMFTQVFNNTQDAMGGGANYAYRSPSIPIQGIRWQRCYANNLQIFYNPASQVVTLRDSNTVTRDLFPGIFTIKDSTLISQWQALYTTTAYHKFVIDNTIIQNIQYDGFMGSGYDFSLTNCEIFGQGIASSGGFTIATGGSIGSTGTVENIYIDKCTTAMRIGGISMDVLTNKVYFGTQSTNTTDFAITSNLGACKAIFNEMKNNPTLDLNSRTSLTPKSYIRFSNWNGVNGDNRIILRNGTIVATGASLSDTTVHNGGLGMRFESAFSGDVPFTQNIPTGNIQNKDMMVGVWVNIANSAYWAGTHTMPRITVTYDNGTTVYGEAAQVTGWQFILAPFTPTTTSGVVEVKFTTNTDATGSNSYVYFDDFSALYPAGHTLALGNMDLWYEGAPVVPMISTSVSAQDVWAADPTQFGASTVGDKVNKIKKIVTGLQ